MKDKPVERHIDSMEKRSSSLYLVECWSCRESFFKIGSKKVRFGYIEMLGKKRQLTMDHPICEECFECFLDEIIGIIEDN